jgi:hypothetical protein
MHTVEGKGGGKVGDETGPPREFFEKLGNENAIKV